MGFACIGFPGLVYTHSKGASLQLSVGRKGREKKEELLLVTLLNDESSVFPKTEALNMARTLLVVAAIAASALRPPAVEANVAKQPLEAAFQGRNQRQVYVRMHRKLERNRDR